MNLKMMKTANDSTENLTPESENEKYRIGCFAPKALQYGNNSKCFLATTLALVFISTFVSDGMLPVNVYALERRFMLSEIQSAMVTISYDIAFCIATLFVSFWGMDRNKPKLIAIGAGIFGLGNLIYSLPHFTTGNYNIVDGPLIISCAFPSTNITTCFQSENLSNYAGVFLLGTVLMGIGASPVFSLGLSYIAENVAANTVPVYFGLFCGTGFMGPMLGFLATGGFQINYFVDFDKGIKTNLFFPGPRYVGAWWPTPLIVMGAVWIVGIFVSGFPKHLPGTKNRNFETENGNTNHGRNAVFGKGPGCTAKDFQRTIWVIVCNPAFVCVAASAFFQALVLSGINATMISYVEDAFHKQFEQASQLSGFITVTPGVIGNIVAGILINRMKWKTADILKFSCVSLLMGACLLPISFVHCKNADIAGVTVPYESRPPSPNQAFEHVNLTGKCNDHCRCQEEFISPVCGADNLTYFSPCQAGCYGAKIEDGELEPYEYFLCSCVRAQGRNAFPDYCPTDCWTLPIFFVGMFLASMFSFLPLTASLTMNFRVVPDKVHTFSIGWLWFFIRGVGAISGPLIYRGLFDTTCLLWKKKLCDGSRGDCYIYDNHNVTVVLVCTSVTLNLIAVAFYAIIGCVEVSNYEVDACRVVKPSSQTKSNSLTKEGSLSGICTVYAQVDRL